MDHNKLTNLAFLILSMIGLVQGIYMDQIWLVKFMSGLIFTAGIVMAASKIKRG